MRPHLIALLLLLPACPGRDVTDDTPDGAVRLLLDHMRYRDRDRAYALLAPETQRELERRARQASEEAGRDIPPAEMLAVERFVLRWDLGRMSTDIDGDRATVVVSGSEEGQRAEVRCVRVDRHWRVILPL